MPCPWIPRPIILIALLILVVAAAPAQGRAGGVPAMQASLGFGGWVVPGRWMPLTVDLDRPLPGGVIELRRSREAGSPASVERFVLGQSIHLEIPLFIDENARVTTLRLLYGDQLLAQREIPALAHVFTGHLILSGGLSLAERTSLGQLLVPREPIQVISWSAGRLPASMLSLDAVSAVVLRDPGQILGPQQRAALRAWLAGGGRLVVLDDPDGLWARSLVTDPVPAEAGTAAIRRRFGLGELSSSWSPGGQTRKMDTAGPWRELLELPPYDQSWRISAGSAFPRGLDRPAELRVQLISQVPAVFQVAVFLGLMLAACLFRKHLFRILVPLSLMGLAVGVFWWTAPEAAWQKGSILHQRAIFLPRQAGLLLAGSSWFPEAQAGRLAGIDRSPWGVTLGWIDQDATGATMTEGGRLLGNSPVPAAWIHQNPPTRMLLRSASAASWLLNGFLPDSLATSGFKAQFRFRYEGGQLRLSADPGGSGQWRDIEAVPASLEPDLAWLRAVARQQPGSLWQVGLDRLEGPGLRLDGYPAPPLTWISLVGEGLS